MTVPIAMPATAAGGPASMTLQRRVEWADTDASGHWHVTAVLRLIESGETMLLERLGILDALYGNARLPRVHLELDFRRPARLGDRVEVATSVVGVGASSLTLAAEIRLGGEVCATATVVSAYRVGSRAVRFPDDLRHLLLTSGPQLPEPPGDGYDGGEQATAHPGTQREVRR